LGWARNVACWGKWQLRFKRYGKIWKEDTS
jgi:hypothetical protein